MILKYLGKRGWILVCICTVCMFCQCYLDLAIPGYMSSVTETLQNGGTVEQVISEGRMMLYCAFGSFVFSVIVALTSSRVAASMATRLRKEQFERVSSFSVQEINRFTTASLINRFTNDISQIQRMIVTGLNALTKTPIMASLALMKISGGSWQWTAVTAISVVCMIAVIAVVMWYVIPRFKRIQSLTDDVNRVTEENLVGVRVVRAYNAESYQEARSDGANEALTANNLSARHAMSVMMPFVDTVMNMLTVSIYFIGALLIMDAYGSSKVDIFSDMVVFSSYTMHVVLSFVFMIMTLMQMPRALVSSKRVQEVIDTVPTIVSGTAKPPMAGTVEFRDVSFRYPEAAEDCLSGISFKVAAGETVAIIGATGSGKSTLVNLMLRFYDVSGGSVSVDGTDVREYDLDSLRSRFSYVPQNVVLFTGTVGYNVGFGLPSDADRISEIRRALDIAQASSFVDEMEGGIDAKVSQGGTNLSGGQRQRLSIARAICKRAEIMVFDDSFSALDYKTDRNLRNALAEECKGSTKIIVAQRVSTIVDADRIIVLDDGKIVGNGTHKELLENCEVYREIASSQLTEEEMMQ